MPCDITSTVIARVLSLICPPSDLGHLSTDLLSLPLIQRHHFLNITPHNPASYLTWPGSDPQPVLSLLEVIRPEDLADLLQSPSIRYIADPEASYAHVRITPTTTSIVSSQSSLRLIFLWDESSASWKYHNSAIGDFPKNSHPDLSHAMAFFQSPNDFLPEQSYSFTVDDEGDAAYWNAYTAPDQPSQSRSLKNLPDLDSDDAYWAQYSSIQGQLSPSETAPSNPEHSPGSADSTIPSPRPSHPSLQLAEQDERIFVPSNTLNPHISQEVYNPLAPPTPGTLSRRLASLPTRPDSPPLHEPDDEPPSPSPSLSPQSTRPNFTELEELLVPLPPTSASSEAGHPDIISSGSAHGDEALKSAIKGIYQLWRSPEKSQQGFMALVQQTIQEP